MNCPLVSIITVNYDTPDVTRDFLISLQNIKNANWEVIVVDNASPKHSSIILKEEFPFIKHISSPKNLGFAGGNNLGLAFAEGDFYFFINNDTTITADVIQVLVDYLLENEQVGIVCPKIKYFYHPTKIQYAGAIGLDPLTSRSSDIGYLEEDLGQRNDIRETDLPNGAAMMISRKNLEKVGKMSEMFFLYYEELDWAARFKKLGMPVHYNGTVEIYHKESISTGKNSAFKTYYLFRNRLLYIRRNYQGKAYFIAGAFFVFISCPVHILKNAVKMQFQHAKSIFKSLFWNLKNNAFQEPKNHSSTFLNELKLD